MTRKLQILRGTTAQNNAYTGAVGELTMDTDRNEVRIHDGQTVGGIKISDRNMPILTSMFFDHITNDMSWLRADTFSWQSGDVYVAAYEHLSSEYKGLYIVASGDILGEENTYYRDSSKDTTPDITGKQYFAWVAADGAITYTASTRPNVGDATLNQQGSATGTITESTAKSDTIGDITITYYLAEDGHKICLPDQESNLVALYESTGVAWYYLLDTTNKQFKLPRTKWGFTGLRDSVGGYVPQDVLLPDIYGSIGNYWTGSATGAFYADTSNLGSESNTDHNKSNTSFKASRISSVYSGDGTNTLIQPRGTQMYLYFYVGNFEQSAIEQTAGITSETLNGKADVDLSNIPANYDYVVESQMPTADNGYTWYRKYKSGWVEQGGKVSSTGVDSTAFSFPVPFKDINYVLVANPSNSTTTALYTISINNKTTTGATLYRGGNVRDFLTLWVAYGVAE